MGGGGGGHRGISQGQEGFLRGLKKEDLPFKGNSGGCKRYFPGWHNRCFTVGGHRGALQGQGRFPGEPPQLSQGCCSSYPSGTLCSERKKFFGSMHAHAQAGQHSRLKVIVVFLGKGLQLKMHNVMQTQMSSIKVHCS